MGSLGPRNINPLTNQPYGLDFPVITIKDMVRAQESLLDHLGIKTSLCYWRFNGRNAAFTVLHNFSRIKLFQQFQ